MLLAVPGHVIRKILIKYLYSPFFFVKPSFSIVFLFAQVIFRFAHISNGCVTSMPYRSARRSFRRAYRRRPVYRRTYRRRPSYRRRY
jgi:hypothetical protein